MADDDDFNPFLMDIDAAKPAAPSKQALKFIPKRKGAAAPKPEHPPEPQPASVSSAPPSIPVSVKQQQEEDVPETKPVPARKQHADVVFTEEVLEESGLPSFNGIIKEEAILPDGDFPMDVDDEDVVVREIDVFLNPSPLADCTQLYVMQYPLRPYWRPYELGERCQQVRVMPQQMQVEFDLTIDTDGDNYDDEADVHGDLQVQTLCSSKAPYVTSYAVGFLKGNQLHLNPVNAVVQLRPSLEYIKTNKMQKAMNIGHVTIDEENEEKISKLSSSKGKLPQSTEEESIELKQTWVPLEFYSVEDYSSQSYREKMISKIESHIKFNVNSSDYLNDLCPLPSIGNNEVKGPSKQILLSMSLEERFKILFSEVSLVHRFDSLLHYTSTESEENILKLLPQYAHLVQGHWVSKSSLLNKSHEKIAIDLKSNKEDLERYYNYILFLFTKSNTIPFEKLKPIKSDIQRRILTPIARERPLICDWKFKEPADVSFIKRYSYVVKEQEGLWSSYEEKIMAEFHKTGKSAAALAKQHIKLGMINRTPMNSKVDNAATRGRGFTDVPGKDSVSDEAREAIVKAVVKVLQNLKVCSFKIIFEKIRDMCIAQSSIPKGDPTIIIAAKALANISRFKGNLGLKCLQDFISPVTIKIHDVYVLKSLGNPVLDPLRNVVIELLRGIEAKAKLKKDVIFTAAKEVLKRDISNAEYTQVLNELCVSQKGAGWVLKDGDGKPD